MLLGSLDSKASPGHDKHPRIQGALGLQARWTGDQLDDDRNELRLGSFTTVDALVARPLAPGLEAFLVGENLLDERYETGRTPVRTLGPPRTFRLGLRFERGGR